jgi:SAM-dependent methyltransferase
MARIEPFNRYMSDYEDWFEKNHFTYISELQTVKKQIAENAKSVEIGVGTGRFAAPLGIKLGLEPSFSMRNRAKQQGIQVVGGVAEELPFAGGLFDLVLMVTTICFLDDIETAFREVNRILIPNGNFIIGFIDKDSPLGKQYQKYKEQNNFYKIATFYSVDEIKTVLERTGFDRFSFAQTIFHPLNEIRKIEPVTDGYGRGSFVAINAKKGV